MPRLQIKVEARRLEVPRIACFVLAEDDSVDSVCMLSSAACIDHVHDPCWLLLIHELLPRSLRLYRRFVQNLMDSLPGETELLRDLDARVLLAELSNDLIALCPHTFSVVVRNLHVV